MTGASTRLLGDRRGVTVVEFGLLAPVLCLVLMGTADLLHRGYAQDILDGEMQQVARDSALEGAPLKLEEIDRRMTKRVRRVAIDGEVEVARNATPDFLKANPERFTDEDGDGVYDRGECFDDTNENKIWDSDPGRKGQGGANDVVRITTTIKYRRLFPMAGLLGWNRQQTLVSRTYLKNQPFAAQATSTVVTICDD